EAYAEFDLSASKPWLDGDGAGAEEDTAPDVAEPALGSPREPGAGQDPFEEPPHASSGTYALRDENLVLDEGPTSGGNPTLSELLSDVEALSSEEMPTEPMVPEQPAEPDPFLTFELVEADAFVFDLDSSNLAPTDLDSSDFDSTGLAPQALPAESEEVAEAAASEPDPPVSEQGASRPPSGAVLVVEDNDETRLLIGRVLEGFYEVEAVADARTALQRMASRFYDALVLDINLGGRKTGVDVLRVARALPGYEDVVAVALTAYALPGDDEHLLDEGFDHYISKPFTKRTLLDAIAAGRGKSLTRS